MGRMAYLKAVVCDIFLTGSSLAKKGSTLRLQSYTFYKAEDFFFG